MKIKKLIESKKMSEGISTTEPVVKFQGKSAYTLTKDKKWEVDFDEAGNIVARTRHGKPSYFKGHINDKVNDFPSTDEDNIILAAREQHGLKFGDKEVNEGYSHFEFTSGANPYIAKTKNEVERIKRSRGDSVRYIGNIDGIDYYKVDDSEEEIDLFRFDEAFKPSESGIQSVKVYNKYNYTIQELRVDNDKKTFERGNFTAGKADKKVKNRQEYEDIVDSLKKMGYEEIPSDYNSLRNKTRKGVPTNESKSLKETYWIDNKEVMDEVDRLSNELQNDGWTYREDKYTGSKYYVIFMKRANNTAVFKGIVYSHTHKPEIIDVTSAQVMGREPMDSFDGMRRKLGKMLLPQRESIKTFGACKKKLDEAEGAFYVTVYEESSTSGPEEGGYTSYGWEAIRSRKFNSEDRARQYRDEFIEGAEVTNEHDNIVEIVDEYGDRYKVAIETEENRGSANSPAKSWAQAEMGVEFDKPFFDDEGKRLPEDPKVTAKRKADREALKQEYINRVDACKTKEDVMVLLSDIKYDSLDDYPGFVSMAMEKYKSLEESKSIKTFGARSKKLRESADYKVKFFQVFEAPKSPKENGKMIGQRGSLEDANAFGKKKAGEGNYIIKAVCDDGKVRNIDNDTKSDAFKMVNESKESDESELITQYLNNGEFDKLEKVQNGTNVIWKLKDNINEASYGGAFDIEDDQLFTRDDIEEASEDVLGHINETFDTPFHLGGTWFENGEWIVNVQTEDGFEFEEKVKVDFRKIRNPFRDLKEKYAMQMAALLIDMIKKDYYFEEELEEAFEGTYSDKFRALITENATDNELLASLCNDIIRYCPEEDLKDLWIRNEKHYVSSNGVEELKESATDAEPIETGAAVGVASVLNGLIIDEYEAIEGYNTAIVNAEAEGYGDMVKVLTDIQAEENIHVGQLQELMKMVDPNADKAVEGEQEAAEQLNDETPIEG